MNALHNEALPIIINMLENLNGHDARLDRQCVTGFLGIKGSKYSGKLLVIGQAVNGWCEDGYELVVASATDHTVCERHAKRLIHLASKPEPMTWVTKQWDTQGNSTNHSFWQVIKGVVAGLGITDVTRSDWPEYIAWTNLSKVSPSEEGNPKILLKRYQLNSAQKLLSLELEEFQPEKILFLSGVDWATPFLDDLKFTGTGTPEFEFIESAGQIKLNSGKVSKVVICRHPERKAGAREDWSKEISGYFNSLPG